MEKTCKICGIIKDSNDFHGRVCKSCIKYVPRKYKKCKECKITKKINNFRTPGGHICLDCLNTDKYNFWQPTQKTCKQCLFVGDKSLFKGNYCKSCIKINNHVSNKKFWEENKEEIKLTRQSLEYKAKAREYTKERTMQYPEKVKEERKKYKTKNKDKIRKRKQIFNSKRENKDKRNKQRRERRKIDPIFKLREQISSSIRAIIKSNGGDKNRQSFQKFLPYTIEELKNHLQSLWEPWMNWNNWTTYNCDIWNDNDQSTWTWNIDHIYPQSKLPYTSMEHENFQKCWALDNLRPLSAKVNLLKGNK
jgi:hypothetical protein